MTMEEAGAAALLELTAEEAAAFEAFGAGEGADEGAAAAGSGEFEDGAETDREDEGAEQPEGGKGRSRTINYGAFHEERERRKALETENRRLLEERARFDERLRIIQEHQAQAAQRQAPQDDPEPDHVVDAIAWIDWRRRQDAKAAQETAAERKRREEAEANDRNYRQFVSVYSSQVSEYAKKEPAVNEAYNWLIKHRAQEYELTGLSPAEAQQAVHQEEINIAYTAMQNGINPGERILALAKYRGWKPGGLGGVTNDSAVADRIRNTAEAVERNRSLSQAGGAAPANEMTAERLIQMDHDEFEAWVNKNPRAAKRLMGA